MVEGVCHCLVEHLGYDIERQRNCEKRCHLGDHKRIGTMERVIPCGVGMEIYDGPPKPGLIRRWRGLLHKRVIRVATFNTEYNSVALMRPEYAIRFHADGMTSTYKIQPADRYVIARWNGLWDVSDILRGSDATECFDEMVNYLTSFMVTGGDPKFPLFRNKLFQVV